MASKRLVGKALIELHGKPLLQRVCNRVRGSQLADEVMVATSERPEDDPIAESCQEWGITVFRGQEKDLTTRLLGAVHAKNLDGFVRVTGDNPLTDPDGIDEMIDRFLHACNAADDGLVIHNMHRKGYPYGTGAEVISRSLLEWCNWELHSPDDRENFAQRAKRDPRFACVKLDAPGHLLRPQYFLTVDYNEDLYLQREIFGHFSDDNHMSLAQVIEFLDANPKLATMNSHLHRQFPD